jgi:acyl-coenzyme A thioesterase PaaI-like protein
MNYFAENADNLTGREQLERIMQGQGAPHFSKLLGMRLIEIGDGTATFEAFPSERFYNPGGSVHGGFYATIIDSAMGCAVQTRMAKGTRFGTIELKTNFIGHGPHHLPRLGRAFRPAHADSRGPP